MQVNFSNPNYHLWFALRVLRHQDKHGTFQHTNGADQTPPFRAELLQNGGTVLLARAKLTLPSACSGNGCAVVCIYLKILI